MEILEIVADLKIGGAQRVAANIAKYAPADYHFTYVVFGKDVGEYESEILASGHRVIHLASPNKGRRQFFRELSLIMRERHYDVVHCHTMYSCGAVMQVAKMHHIPGRLSHSHTALDQVGDHSPWRKSYKNLMRAMIRQFGTDYLACGQAAGVELYGERLFSTKGIIIKNGMDTETYRFSEKNRNSVRIALGLDDCFIIGHVGHYEKVKNQKFLIRLMSEVLKKQPNAFLLLYGEGSERKVLEQEILSLHLKDHIRVMGNARNIPEVLSAFDVFAFPSLFEGTPLSLLEAQTNGLPCVISDRIPEDACITDLICTLPLEDPAGWVEALLIAKRHNPERYPDVISENYETIQKSMAVLYCIYEKYSGKSD